MRSEVAEDEGEEKQENDAKIEVDKPDDKIQEREGDVLDDRELWEEDDLNGPTPRTNTWLKGFLDKRSNHHVADVDMEKRSTGGWEGFVLEEINPAGERSQVTEDEDEVVVFDKYNETGLYVNNLTADFVETTLEGKKKTARQRVNSAENEDVKRIKSEDEKEKDEGWDWTEVGGEEDVDKVKEVVRKKTMKKRTCRKGFHISGCRCKPLTVVADTSV